MTTPCASASSALPGADPPAGWTRAEASWLLAAMLIVALLVVPALGATSFWFDEVFSVTAAHDWTGLYRTFVTYENNMALYYALLRVWMALFGDGEAAVRSLSLFFALATLPVVHLLGRRLFGVRAAICADLLLALSYHFLALAQEARSYALLILLSALTVLLFAEAIRTRSARIWAGFAVVGALAVYAHYFGLLTVGACFAAAMWWARDRRLRWQVAGAGLLFAALLVPLVVVRPPDASQVDWLGRPHLRDLMAFASWLASGQQYLVAAYALCAAFALWRLRRVPPSQRHAQAWPFVLLLSWLVLPALCAFAASWAIKPVFNPKYLLGSLPAVLLLVTAGLARLPRGWALAALAVMIVPLGWRYVRVAVPHNGTEDWRGATARIVAAAHPDDAVICFPFYCSRPVRFYLAHQPAATPNLDPQELASAPYHPGGGTAVPPPDLARLDALAARSPRIWLVDDISRDAAGSGRQAITDRLVAHYGQQEVIQVEGLRATLFSAPLR